MLFPLCIRVQAGVSRPITLRSYPIKYRPFSFDDAYITWVNDGKPAWTLYSAGLGADTRSQISARPMPLEPMVIPLLLHIFLMF